MKSKKHIYWIRDSGEGCPLCSSKLKSCHVGTYCYNKDCPYFDGAAWLNDEEAKKFSHLIIRDFK